MLILGLAQVDALREEEIVDISSDMHTYIKLSLSIVSTPPCGGPFSSLAVTLGCAGCS
jgi:hypothetical protein